MLWLYLLGAVTLLIIALRRVLRRQAPLNDELYSKRVAIEHVQSGVAWVRADGTIGSVNQSYADALRVAPGDLIGKDWYGAFPPEEKARVEEQYRETLLKGVVSFETSGQRGDGSLVWLNVRLVAVHDRRMRFVGHHCLIEDRSRERELEQQIGELTKLGAYRPDSDGRSEPRVQRQTAGQQRR